MTLQDVSKRLKLMILSADDLLTAYPEFSYPDVLKIDTDGFEPAILRGAKSAIGIFPTRSFLRMAPDFYHRAGENNTGHADLLMELGYEGF